MTGTSWDDTLSQHNGSLYASAPGSEADYESCGRSVVEDDAAGAVVESDHDEDDELQDQNENGESQLSGSVGCTSNGGLGGPPDPEPEDEQAQDRVSSKLELDLGPANRLDVDHLGINESDLLPHQHPLLYEEEDEEEEDQNDLPEYQFPSPRGYAYAESEEEEPCEGDLLDMNFNINNFDQDQEEQEDCSHRVDTDTEPPRARQLVVAGKNRHVGRSYSLYKHLQTSQREKQAALAGAGLKQNAGGTTTTAPVSCFFDDKGTGGPAPTAPAREGSSSTEVGNKFQIFVTRASDGNHEVVDVTPQIVPEVERKPAVLPDPTAHPEFQRRKLAVAAKMPDVIGYNIGTGPGGAAGGGSSSTSSTTAVKKQEQAAQGVANSKGTSESHLPSSSCSPHQIVMQGVSPQKLPENMIKLEQPPDLADFFAQVSAANARAEEEKKQEEKAQAQAQHAYFAKIVTHHHDFESYREQSQKLSDPPKSSSLIHPPGLGQTLHKTLEANRNKFAELEGERVAQQHAMGLHPEKDVGESNPRLDNLRHELEDHAQPDSFLQEIASAATIPPLLAVEQAQGQGATLSSSRPPMYPELGHDLLISSVGSAGFDMRLTCRDPEGNAAVVERMGKITAGLSKAQDGFFSQRQRHQRAGGRTRG
eukprot:g14057.t1